VVSAFFWAWVVGTACNIACGLTAHSNEFKQSVDSANYLIKEVGLPNSLAGDMRLYMHSLRHTRMLRRQLAVMNDLSPALQIQVVDENVTRWGKAVPVFHTASKRFALALFKQMAIQLYQPVEIIQGHRTLFVVERGVCRIHERLLFTGHSFGEDFQLENPKLRRDEHGAKCLTFVETRSLSFKDFSAQLEEFPRESARVRREKHRLALLRGVLGTGREPGSGAAAKFQGVVFNAAPAQKGSVSDVPARTPSSSDSK